MNNIIKLLDNTTELDINDSDYIHNGKIVPRVTKIISKCIHSDGLMYWANSLGFKHQSYSKTIRHAADIGTQCHNNIDAFLENKNHSISDKSLIEAKNAYNSFIKWFNDVNALALVKVIFHEKTLTCKYFGGTLDGLYEINGKIYLVDYKTSNHITFTYILQLAAYRYMLRTELGIEIDGCIILQLSKTGIAYNEYVLNFCITEHLKYINECEHAFLSIVYAYYNISRIESGFNNIKWEVV